METSGYLGIGTTSPANKLDVAGSMAIGSGYVGTAAPTSGMIVQGSVGMGTTSPQDNLHVVYPYSKTDTNERFVFETSSNDASGRYGLKISSIGGASPKYLLQTHVAGVSNSGNLALQPYGGTVGIGTTSPAQTLDVNGNIRTSGRLIIAGTAPTHSTGTAGDKAGMIAWDTYYFYVCRSDYDGFTNIWRRISLPTGTW